MRAWPILMPFSVESIGPSLAAYQKGTEPSIPATASATWVANNMALFFPFRIGQEETIYEFFLLNGVGVEQAFDIAIFDTNFHKLVSTSNVLQSGASQIQKAGPIGGNYVLPKGSYYLAMAMQSTNQTVYGVSLTSAAHAPYLRALGCCQQAGAGVALPDDCTPAGGANIFVPVFGALLANIVI